MRSRASVIVCGPFVMEGLKMKLSEVYTSSLEGATWQSLEIFVVCVWGGVGGGRCYWR